MIKLVTKIPKKDNSLKGLFKRLFGLEPSYIKVTKRDLAEFEREKILNDLLYDEYNSASKKNEKLTKDEVTARVKSMDTYIEANEEYLEYKKLAKEWEQLTEAIKIKTSMLKKLVELILANLGGDISLSIAKAVGTRGKRQIDRFNMNTKRKEIQKKRFQRRE